MDMRWLGRALRPLRPGVDALTTARIGRRRPRSIAVTSPTFGEGDDIPRRYTADGRGWFPGVSWSELPAGTRSVALLVEDADIPFVRPVTHLIVHSIPPDLTGLEPGAVPSRANQGAQPGWSLGRNFLGALGWTPPAPPPGHGGHRYAFQVFALDIVPSFRHPPRRAGLMRAIRSHILAYGSLIGVYKRP